MVIRPNKTTIEITPYDSIMFTIKQNDISITLDFHDISDHPEKS